MGDYSYLMPKNRKENERSKAADLPEVMGTIHGIPIVNMAIK